MRKEKKKSTTSKSWNERWDPATTLERIERVVEVNQPSSSSPSSATAPSSVHLDPTERNRGEEGARERRQENERRRDGRSGGVRRKIQSEERREDKGLKDESSEDGQVGSKRKKKKSGGHQAAKGKRLEEVSGLIHPGGFRRKNLRVEEVDKARRRREG